MVLGLIRIIGAVILFMGAQAGVGAQINQDRPGGSDISASETRSQRAVEASRREKPWIGIINKASDLSSIEVKYVYRNSPAAIAGLRVGDRITAVDGKSFSDQPEFDRILGNANRPAYTLSIYRVGLTHTVLVPFSVEPEPGSLAYEAIADETRAFIHSSTS